MEEILEIINNIGNIEDSPELFDELNTLNKKELLSMINFSISKGHYKLLDLLLKILIETDLNSSELNKLKNYLEILSAPNVEIEIDGYDSENETNNIHVSITKIKKHIKNMVSILKLFFENYEKQHGLYYKKWKRKI